MTYPIENIGIGALYGTFTIDKTGDDYDLTSEDLGAAVSLSGNNEVDKGTDGGALLGRLENVKEGIATVQIQGVVRLEINTGKTAPSVGDQIVVDGAGKVYQAPALTGNDPAGGNISRGTVLAVNSNDTCDVLL